MSSKKRGANGGGTIRQRADGTWEARITLGTNPGTGKPVRKSIYGKTQKEVRCKDGAREPRPSYRRLHPGPIRPYHRHHAPGVRATHGSLL